jgi:undecaprenyl-diphosphatase
MQAVDLADEVRAVPARGPRDEVVCAGVEGPNLAATALAAFRARTGWDGPPLRLEIAKRIPVAAGMAGGSADAAAALRVAAAAAGVQDDALLREIAAGLGADVPAQVAGALAGHGGGRARRAAARAGALRGPRPPGRRPPADARGLREADRLGLPRDGAGLAEGLRTVRVRAADLPDALVVNELEPAARSLRPSIARPCTRRARPARTSRSSRGRGRRCSASSAIPRRPRAPRRTSRATGPPSRAGPCEASTRVKPLWLVFGAGLALVLVLRRRRLEPTLLVGGALGCVGSLVYGLGLVELPDLETLLTDLGRALGTWTYLLVGVLAFLETGAFVGLLAPGETTIIVGGVVAGQGEIDIVALIALVWVCAVAGDVTSFLLGRRLGRAFLVRHGPKVQIGPERLEQVEQFFARHGGAAVLLGRFVGIVRAVAPFLAGSGGMPLRRFLPYDILGAGLWGTTYCLLGYAFWRSLGTVLDVAEQGALALGTVIVVVVGIGWLSRFLGEQANRRRVWGWLERQERRPVAGRLWRPAVRGLRRAVPALRFLGNRLTPGGLGLEFTTLLAIAAVGAFALVGYAITLSVPTELTAGDRRGLRWGRQVESGSLTELSQVVTELGALPVAGPRSCSPPSGCSPAGRSSRRSRSPRASR